MRSPLLETDGAVGRLDPDTDPTTGADTTASPETDPDAAVPAHFGDPFAEQRAIARRAGVVDRSHRGVVVVPGADRLSWLHLLLSQQVADLDADTGTEGLVLDASGRVQHHAVLSHTAGPDGPDSPAVWLDVEPGTAGPLAAYLDSMRFWSDVAPRDATDDYAVLSLVGPATDEVLTAAGVTAPAAGTADRPGAVALPGGGVARRAGLGPLDGVDLLVPRDGLRTWWDRLRGAGAAAAGLDAYEAVRVAALRPRLGHDTDEKTIPHEVGWIGAAVHLAKGCYRGQETVSRVANLGRPPRQLVLLHLAAGDDPSRRRARRCSPPRAGAPSAGWAPPYAHHELGDRRPGAGQALGGRRRGDGTALGGRPRGARPRVGRPRLRAPRLGGAPGPRGGPPAAGMSGGLPG